MSQNTDTSNQTSTATDATVVDATASKASASADLLTEIAERLRASATDVQRRLANKLVEKQVLNRVDLLEKGLAKQEQLQGELKKIQPPSKKTFALVDGKMVEVQATYSQDEVKKHNEETKQYNKKLKEATEKLNKFNNVLNAALAGSEPDKLVELYAKLAKAVGGGSVDEDEKKDEE